MTKPPASSNKTTIESAIGYLLIGGVSLSLLLEIAGMAAYYFSRGNLDISADPSMFIQGHDFFWFVASLITGGFSGEAWRALLTSGIVVLLLTPLARVVLSVVFFGLEKNVKYVVITALVLAALVASLALH